VHEGLVNADEYNNNNNKSAILELLCGCLYHPRIVFGGIHHCAKFGWNRYSTFHNMQVFDEFGLKIPTQAPSLILVTKENERTSLKLMLAGSSSRSSISIVIRPTSIKFGVNIG